MQHWEYQTVFAEAEKHSNDRTTIPSNGLLLFKSEEFAKLVNSLGGEGWEMISQQIMPTGIAMTFKRPLAQPVAQ